MSCLNLAQIAATRNRIPYVLDSSEEAVDFQRIEFAFETLWFATKLSFTARSPGRRTKLVRPLTTYI